MLMVLTWASLIRELLARRWFALTLALVPCLP